MALIPTPRPITLQTVRGRTVRLPADRSLGAFTQLVSKPDPTAAPPPAEAPTINVGELLRQHDALVRAAKTKAAPVKTKPVKTKPAPAATPAKSRPKERAATATHVRVRTRSGQVVALHPATAAREVKLYGGTAIDPIPAEVLAEVRADRTGRIEAR